MARERRHTRWPLILLNEVYLEGRRMGCLLVLARPGLLTKLTADRFTSKTQEEARSQKRALTKGWERPGFIVNSEGTLEN